ncbi:MAG: hypothetical protein EPN97_04845 [Alphaproteobacteria bacterium]|nr:MAG: hypothetical protein EPN97_04845 [Alphaproteobacteria bacterium]
MGVVIWKKQHAYFGTLVGKTSLDIAVENYACSGERHDFDRLVAQAALRRQKEPSEMTPRDIVVRRVIETGGCMRELAMLRALVRAKRPFTQDDFRRGAEAKLARG